MSERVNIDLDLVQNGGEGLYVADDEQFGTVVCEERPGDPVAAANGFLTTTDEEDGRVLRTRNTDEADVELVDAESGEVVDTVFAAEVGPREIPTETLEDRGLVALSLVN